MDHPMVREIEQTGYPKMQKIKNNIQFINVCVCGYEAEVRFKGTPLCSECCKEEGIQLI